VNADHAFAGQVASPEERARIFLCAMLIIPRATLGFSYWAVQRCLEATAGPEECRKIVACMRYVICPLLTSSLYEY
jgi:hypothetical protein